MDNIDKEVAEAAKVPHTPLYYEKLGRAVDYILRCDFCQKLIVTAEIEKSKGCPNCGNRRYNEVRTLTLWEQLKIRLGLIKFPHSGEFLAEFKRRG